MQLRNHKKVITDDGSLSYFSLVYDELCHSKCGAKEETHTHYIKGCDIQNKINLNHKLNILEVGFGTGLGFMETKRLFKGHKSKLHFVSLEIDPELIDIFELEQKIRFKKNESSYIYQHDNITLEIYLGDARRTILELQQKYKKSFDAIYQDAFSPRKNPTLWSVEWFEALKFLAKDDCILSTYSASSSIRKSMLKAGWSLKRGERFKEKRSSTRADLSGVSDELITQKLSRSPVSALTDKNIAQYVSQNRKLNEKNQTLQDLKY